MKEQLKELAEKLTDAEKGVTDAEQALKDAKKKLETVSATVVPDALENLGIEEFTTDDGRRIVVEDVIRASVPAARKTEAMRWLDENKHGDLIKTFVTIAFDRSELKLAKQTMANLDESYDNVQFAQKVEPQTLAAWVREQLEQGQPIPMDLFGVFEQKKAKIKKPRKTKK